MRLQCWIWFYINFNAAVTALESGFSEHLVGEIINLALVEFLCNLGVQYILGGFLFIPVTSRLYLSFRNDVISEAFLSTGLVAFICVDVVLLKLMRASSLIKT